MKQSNIYFKAMKKMGVRTMIVSTPIFIIYLLYVLARVVIGDTVELSFVLLSKVMAVGILMALMSGLSISSLFIFADIKLLKNEPCE